jgi:hypothetical protein
MSTAHNPNSGQDRLEAARRELQQLKAKINFSTNLTIVIAIVMMCALGGWLGYGSYLWDQVTEPGMLVNYVGTEYIDKKIPGLSTSLAREIERSSPTWAKNLSDKMIGSMPDARIKLESFVLEQMETTIQKTHGLTEDEIRKFIKKNRSTLEKNFKELASNQELPKVYMEEIELAMDDDLKVDMQAEAIEILTTLKNANKAWKNMLGNKNLSNEEQLERRVWTLARRLQLEEFEPERLVPEKTPGEKTKEMKKSTTTTTKKSTTTSTK